MTCPLFTVHGLRLLSFSFFFFASDPQMCINVIYINPLVISYSSYWFNRCLCLKSVSLSSLCFVKKKLPSSILLFSVVIVGLIKTAVDVICAFQKRVSFFFFLTLESALLSQKKKRNEKIAWYRAFWKGSHFPNILIASFFLCKNTDIHCKIQKNKKNSTKSCTAVKFV